MTFAQRRNRLMAHFSVRFPVVKRRISVLHCVRSSDIVTAERYQHISSFYTKDNSPSVLSAAAMCTECPFIWENPNKSLLSYRQNALDENPQFGEHSSLVT